MLSLAVHAPEHAARAACASPTRRESARRKPLDRRARGEQQFADQRIALGVVGRRAPLLDLAQAVVQGLDQQRAPLRVVEQVVFEIGVALHDPDVAQHLVQHARRAAGAALVAQPRQQLPGALAEQADARSRGRRTRCSCRESRAGAARRSHRRRGAATMQVRQGVRSSDRGAWRHSRLRQHVSDDPTAVQHHGALLRPQHAACAGLSPLPATTPSMTETGLSSNWRTLRGHAGQRPSIFPHGVVMKLQSLALASLLALACRAAGPGPDRNPVVALDDRPSTTSGSTTWPRTSTPARRTTRSCRPSRAPTTSRSPRRSPPSAPAMRRTSCRCSRSAPRR